MLRISRRTEYGLLAMRHLVLRGASAAGKPCTAREIAEEHAIPRELLSKVLQRLTQVGLVRSHKGARGGYALAREAVDINVADLVDALDGPVAVVDCLGDDPECSLRDNCCLRSPLERLNGAVRNLLRRVSLAELSQPDEGSVQHVELSR